MSGSPGWFRPSPLSGTAAPTANGDGDGRRPRTLIHQFISQTLLMGLPHMPIYIGVVLGGVNVGILQAIWSVWVLLLQGYSG